MLRLLFRGTLLRRLVAFTVLASFALPATALADFIPAKRPIGLTGYKSSIRTVWFSPDGTQIHGDFDHLVQWDLKTKALVSSVLVPGYKIHPSLISTDGSLWMQGTLGYDDPKKRQIGRTHATLSQRGLDGIVRSKKTGATHFGEGAFVPGLQSAIFVLSKKRRYAVRRFEPQTGKLTTTYGAPTVAKKQVPTEVAVDPSGKLLAVGYGSKRSGVAIYNVQTAKRLHFFRTKAEVTAVQFTGDALFYADLDGRVYRWAYGEKRAKVMMKSQKKILNMAVHPSGTSAIIGALRGVYWVDLKNGTIERRLLKSRAMDIRFSADGDKVAIALNKTLHLAKVPSVYVFENALR